MTTIVQPTHISHAVTVTPGWERFPSTLDPLAGTPVRLHAFTWEHQAYVLAAFASRCTSKEILHPLPLLSSEERQRLLLRQDVALYRAFANTAQPQAERTHKLLRITTYFGSHQAVLAVPTTALLIRDHGLLHVCCDVVEHWLARHHGLMEFLATPYRGGSSARIRHFWYAHGYRPDPLIPARLLKRIPEPHRSALQELRPFWPGASPAWSPPRSLPL